MSELLERLQAALGTAYHLERELGGGGMSRVFVAEETALGRKVVLKVLPPELGAGLSVDRFRREIQLAASLHHPNIVPLFAAGEADGLLYYTMPLIEGDSLRARLAREGELPIGETVRLLRDVVDALSCAHEHGVVHRDIKPDNVLISRHHALVTDFGVAKALSEATGPSALTSVGVALGTPAYMAPEQASGDSHVDHRADIYAVGALGYEMLAGRPPFVAPTPQAVLAAHVTQAPESVTRFRASVPSSFAAVIMRCLEKRPADRWQTADELLHQLEAMATPSGGTEPTQAIPSAAVTATSRGSARSVRWQRAGYLVLGVVLALALAWGVARRRTSLASGEANANKTIVVLPFENLGGSNDQYFADGITEEITNRLTGINGLKVIARSSAKQYKATQKPLRQIGEELGVGYVLEGTVRWEHTGDSSSRVRVSPELIRISDGTNVWAHGYDAVMSGMFQVQSDIAEEVANALHVALAEPEKQAIAARPTTNQEAYDYYLQGHAHLERDYSGPDLFSAVGLLDKSGSAGFQFRAGLRRPRPGKRLAVLVLLRPYRRAISASKGSGRSGGAAPAWVARGPCGHGLLPLSRPTGLRSGSRGAGVGPGGSAQRCRNPVGPGLCDSETGQVGGILQYPGSGDRAGSTVRSRLCRGGNERGGPGPLSPGGTVASAGNRNLSGRT
jgi:serine/threonine-protein kinase